MKVAVLISNMGGPNSLEAVEPFLFEIFNDSHIIDIALPSFVRRRLARFIARKRKNESIEILRKLGGKTPLHKIMRQQAKALQSALNSQTGDGSKFTVWPANRYSHPSLEDVLFSIREEGYERIVVVSMYPFFATSTSGSIAGEIKRLQNKFGISAQTLLYIDRFGNRTAFVRAMAKHIREHIGNEPPVDEKAHLLLSAHSVPQRHLDKGDPYFEEVRQTVNHLQKELPDWLEVHLAFQSKIGPVKWLEPSSAAKIRQLAMAGIKKLFVYPLGFVADNSETVYEIGMLYRDLALQNGIKEFVRIEALNVRPDFINVLSEVVLEHLAKNG